MVKTKIILIPDKPTLDEFFDEDTDSYLFNFKQPDYPETIVMSSLIEHFHPRTIIRIPEVRMPTKHKTPDFLVDGIRYEIKAPESIKGIRGLYLKARKQTRKRGFIVFDFMNMKNASLFECARRAKQYCKRRNPQNYILMHHGDILYSTR
ncbi:hypothetical protein J6X13_00025 [Candidatus Saccharibacteria bacterium]|nr:hypothetical protein [Candidatus Saccharibacteria bacterium]